MAACIRGPRTLANSSELNHKTNSASNYKAFIKTYSKWVNHYLEKARSKKLIQDLQADLTDGVLLADVIEAVTSHKVPNINRKPKTATQMCENIQACLCFLEQLGIALDGINVREVREGNLKAILGLIFGLSVHKQRQKQQQQQQSPQHQQTPPPVQHVAVERDKAQRHSASGQESGLTKLPSPFYNHTNDPGSGSGSGIPTPASTGARPSAIERFNGLNTAVTPLKSASTNSSRSTSPSHSFIPAPRVSARSSLNEKQLTGSGVPRSSNVPTRVSLASPYNPANTKSSIIFTPKEKPKSSIGSTKRTSSSSGFSSARSERSDSSNSLYNDPKQTTLEKKIPSSTDSALRKKLIKTGESKIATKANCKVQQIRPLSKAALDKQNELTNSISSETSDESRLSIGGGSSIPKPLAAVKGTSKPTHCVSPMPVLEQTTIVIENDESIKKKEDDDEKKAKEEIKETEKIVPPTVNNHTKQVSVDEEDCLSNIKPMQPMRGYPKQNGMLQRAHLSTEQLAMHHQSMGMQSQNYMRHLENSRTRLNSDHSGMNGYLSDGEILQNGSSSRSVSDFCDGYMSEGTAIYGSSPNHQRNGAYSQPGKDSKPQPVQRILVKPKSKKLNDDQSKNGESRSSPSTLNTKENHVKILVGEQVISSMDYRGTNGGEPSPAIIYRSGRSHVKKSDSSQQTETSAFPAKQWNSDSSRTPEKRIVSQRKLDKKSSDSHSREELTCIEYCNGDRKLNLRDSKNKVRGVPPSFGYTKRPTNGDGGKGETRTAQVSAVPRTKVKVSGGTQTESINNSQNVRDRISTFPRTSYSSHVPGDLSEAESLPASQSHHRVSLARLSRSNSISYLRDRTFPRSTKSEKVYPSMLQRSEELESYYNIPYNLNHSSQPTSPTPSQMSQGTISRMYYQMWPGGGGSMWSARNMGLLSKVGSKEDDVHGSAVSLYSTPEEKQGLEVRKLRRQLADAHDKVHTLTTQLSTNVSFSFIPSACIYCFFLRQNLLSFMMWILCRMFGII
nr:PREDICTED: neuron navigator 3-like [Bemisia tabaci]